MNEERWGRIEEIFHEVSEAPPEERLHLLDQRCGGDFELRRNVDSLLEAVGDGPNPIRSAVALVARDLSDTGRWLVSQRIGPYALRGKLGSGGMGTVYRAARSDDEFQKEVAIKIARFGLHSPEFVARFKSERQILATLEHAYIARLLDGGTTENGIPYVVIELVDGQPITSYCREISLNERLRLFIKVCEAVEYAHQHLIVHRDLKPANILVTPEGEPKLLDFGIAKLLDREELPVHQTTTNIRLLTPEYASPEQICGDPARTTSDVYSLGVLLFEILAGRHPYREPEDTASELSRKACEFDPPPPSQFIGLNRGDRKAIAGDLDEIVLKALRKEADRRYPSVEQFAADIRRFLNGFPVLARRDTLRYRAGKFVHRNRLAVALAATLATSLIVFGIAMGVLAGRLARERDRAGRVSDFLVNVFRVSDPSESRGNSVRAREILDRGADGIDADPSLDAAVRAALKQTIGRVYQSLGLHKEALPILRQALSIRRSLFGDRSLEVAESMKDLAWSVEMLGDNSEAERLYRQSLALQQALLGANEPVTLETSASLAGLLRVQGRPQEAERLYREVLSFREREQARESVLAAETTHDLAQAIYDQGRYAEAEPLFRRALAIRRRLLGDDHPDVSDNLNNLALLLYGQGRYQEAEPVYRESLRLRRKVLGPEHPDVGNSLNNLALLLARQGRDREAVEMYRDAIALRRKVLGPEHQLTANSIKNLADALRDDGDGTQAEALYQDSLRVFVLRLGEESFYVAGARSGLALLYLAQGRLAEAQREALEALRVRRKVYGADDHRVADSLTTLGFVRMAHGAMAEGEELFREAMRMRSDGLARGQPQALRPLQGLGEILVRKGALTEAEPLLRRALTLRRSTYASPHWSIVEAETLLARCLLEMGRKDEARRLLTPIPPGFAGRGPASARAAKARLQLLTRHGLPSS